MVIFDVLEFLDVLELLYRPRLLGLFALLGGLGVWLADGVEPILSVPLFAAGILLVIVGQIAA